MTSSSTGIGVTVAIACYNQGRFLADAIGSVLAQNHPADVVLVVDDGSTDDTAAVTARYPQVRYHRQSNAGLSAARNTGLALAETSHILFLDADDLLLPNAIADALTTWRANDALGFVYGGYRDVSADRAPLDERPPVTHPDPFLALLHDNFIGMHGTVLYHAARLRTAGGFDTSLPACEDWDVYLRLARDHPIAAYRSLGAEYRRHGASMSTNAARMIATTRLVLERQIAVGLTPEQARMARRGIAFNRRHYALRLLGEIRSGGDPWRALITGLRNDPLFALRLAAAVPRGLARRGGFSRP